MFRLYIEPSSGYIKKICRGIFIVTLKSLKHTDWDLRHLLVLCIKFCPFLYKIPEIYNHSYWSWSS